LNLADRASRHAQRNLPNYAIPLFLRIVKQAALNSSGLKQDKVQPRIEGVDPSKVHDDRLFFLKNGRYQPFIGEDWELLVMAKARL
jgi:hypothetical protein